MVNIFDIKFSSLNISTKSCLLLIFLPLPHAFINYSFNFLLVNHPHPHTPTISSSIQFCVPQYPSIQLNLPLKSNSCGYIALFFMFPQFFFLSSSLILRMIHAYRRINLLGRWLCSKWTLNPSVT